MSRAAGHGIRGRMPVAMAGLSFAAFAATVVPSAHAKSFERDCGALFSPNSENALPESKWLVIEITSEPLAELIPGTGPTMWPPVVKIRNSAGEITLHELQQRTNDDPVLRAIDAATEMQVVAVQVDGTRRELELPEGLKASLREYIRAGGPPTKPFDCNCFVHLMNGIPYKYTRFRTRLWHLDTVYDESALMVGDTIVLGYSYSEVKHVAIYLGYGMYISKMGDGPVLVTDFATLQLGYGGVMLARGRPRSR